MDQTTPLPLPADPTLAVVAAEYEAAGACSIVRDAQWFLVFATSEFMRWDSYRLVPTDPPQHWFGPEVTEYMRQAFGRDHSRHQELILAGPWVLSGTPGGRGVLRARVDPSLVDRWTTSPQWSPNRNVPDLRGRRGARHRHPPDQVHRAGRLADGHGKARRDAPPIAVCEV